jgi:alpha-beta hydrolase superfamily lysophospholipase
LNIVHVNSVFLSRLIAHVGLITLAISVQACVSFPDAPEAIAPPVMASNVVQSVDGALLGLQSWQAEDPKAVIIAVHGMNDYSKTFELSGAWWAQHAAITTYAYDQRGFGRSPDFGHWAGRETMVADLRAVVVAARAQHPGLPIYVLGHSMGAAVVMAAQAEASLDADGLILASPGVWGGRAMPFPYRLSLNMAAMLAPGKTLTGERTGRQASDNIEILREMYNDPLVIKETRLDAVLGVVRVMGAGYGAADEINSDILFLIGEKDEVIPLKTMEKTASRLHGEVDIRRYPDGWHLLFRDLQAKTVWRDVAGWVADHEAGARKAR